MSRAYDASFPFGHRAWSRLRRAKEWAKPVSPAGLSGYQEHLIRVGAILDDAYKHEGWPGARRYAIHLYSSALSR